MKILEAFIIKECRPVSPAIQEDGIEGLPNTTWDFPCGLGLSDTLAKQDFRDVFGKWQPAKILRACHRSHHDHNQQGEWAMSIRTENYRIVEASCCNENPLAQ